MARYIVSWVDKITVFAPVEAESEEEAIAIAKCSKDLDIDTEPHLAKSTNFRAELEEW